MTIRALSQLTYTGLFDDYDYRHWAHGQDLSFVEDVLVTSLLVGNPIVLNDGYLMQHPKLVESLLLDDESLLRRLIEVGWVKVLTRNGGAFDRLHEVMHWGGVVPGYLQQLTDPGFLKELQDWGEKSVPATSLVPFPPHNLGQGYAWWIKRMFDVLEDDGWRVGSCADVLSQHEVEPFVNKFYERLHKSNYGGPRSRWEELVQEGIEDNTIHRYYRPAFLQLGSVVHQINVATALQAANPGVTVHVNTMSCSATESSWLAAESHHQDGLELPYLELPRRVDLDHAAYVGGVPRKWNSMIQLAKLLLGPHDQNEPLVIARYAYLDSVQRASAGDDIDGCIEEVREAATDYSRKLTRHFTGSDDLNRGRGFAVTTVGFVIGLLKPLIDGPLATLAKTGAGPTVGRLSKMLKPFNRGLESIGGVMQTPLNYVTSPLEKPYFWLPRLERQLQQRVVADYSETIPSFDC